MKKSDNTSQKEVSKARKEEPVLHSDKIDIKAHNDALSMKGMDDNYDQKIHAKVKNIAGVQKKRDEIKANLYSSAIICDKEIASLVNHALKSNWAVPSHNIKVAVKDGVVTVEGVLHWDFQRKATDKIIRDVKGVREVIDKIKIGTEIESELNQELIEKALRQNWLLEIDNIKVRVDGKTIFLTGIVESLSQKQKAEKIVWDTQGVCSVANELLVELN